VAVTAIRLPAETWRWNNEPTNRRAPCKSPDLASPLSPLCPSPSLPPSPAALYLSLSLSQPPPRAGVRRVPRGFRRPRRHGNVGWRTPASRTLVPRARTGTRVSAAANGRYERSFPRRAKSPVKSLRSALRASVIEYRLKCQSRNAMAPIYAGRRMRDGRLASPRKVGAVKANRGIKDGMRSFF